MRIANSVFLTATCYLLLVVPTGTVAQPQGDYIGLSAHPCSDGTVPLRIDLDVTNGLPEGLHALQVSRDTPEDCGDPVVVVTEVLESTPGYFVFEYANAVPRHETLYRYQLTGLTESGEEFDLLNTFGYAFILSHSACGSPPLIRGAIYDYGWASWVYSCENTCYVDVYLEDGGLWAQHYGDGTTVAVYGLMGCGGIEGCGIYNSFVVPSDCQTVKTDGLSWGALKGRY